MGNWKRRIQAGNAELENRPQEVALTTPTVLLKCHSSSSGLASSVSIM